MAEKARAVIQQALTVSDVSTLHDLLSIAADYLEEDIEKTQALKERLQELLQTNTELENDLHLQQVEHPTAAALRRKVELLTEEKEHYRRSYESALDEKALLAYRL